MNAELLAIARETLAQVAPMEAQGWAPAQGIARQLRWCIAFASDEPREEHPGPFSMGLIATREFDMYGDRPELADPVNRVQEAAERALR